MSAFPIIRVAPPKGQWSETHTYEEPPVKGRAFVRALFFACKFRVLRSTTFAHCSLQQSSIEPERIEDLLGLTATLDCFNFDGVRFNDLAMDAFLYLLSLTKGNDEKRAILRRMIPEKRLHEFEEAFARLERLR